jgi:hypothetical protein
MHMGRRMRRPYGGVLITGFLACAGPLFQCTMLAARQCTGVWIFTLSATTILIRWEEAQHIITERQFMYE